MEFLDQVVWFVTFLIDLEAFVFEKSVCYVQILHFSILIKIICSIHI